MVINTLVVAKLFVLHFIADGLLQSRDMGKRKSSELPVLAAHMLIQFLVFVFFTNTEFALANMFIHGVIDWNIWRVYKWSVFKRKEQGKIADLFQPADSRGYQFRHWDDGLFFHTILFDQMLHGLTYIFLASYFL